MRLALLASCAALGACTPVPAQLGAMPPAVPGQTCRGEALASFVGQPATAALGAQMLRQSGATTLRWVAKGMMVTMDYRDDRLTVYLTADNRIERANCG